MASASGGLLRYADAAATLDTVYRLGSFTETWFKSIIISLSSLWLILRVYQVFLKPVGELIALLGLEVPAQPNASLAGIKADGVTLHWKLGDNTVTKWQVAINGIGVGELGPKETSVTVYGLQPEQSYTARLVAHNAHFQTASPPVRFTTSPASSNLFYQEANQDIDVDDGEQHQQHQQHQRHQPRHPMIKPAKALYDPMQLPSAQTMVREHSSSLPQRRNTQARRVSSIPTDISVAHPGDENTSEAVRDLTSKLDALRHDNEEAERQEREEQDEFEGMRRALEDERDRYRKLLKEKDDTSRDLKKEVTRLERTNTSVQGGKNTAERKLQHKLNDRQKMKDDIARWDREVEEMKLAVQRLLEQKKVLEKETEAKLDAYRDQLSTSQESNKALEEDIKDRSMQIKTLEQENRKNSDGDVDAAQQAPDALDEEERAFEGRLRSLQSRYTEAWNNMVNAEATYQNCQRHLMFLGQQRRQSTSQMFAPPPAIDAVPRRRTSNGRRHTGGNTAEVQSSAPPAYGALGSQPPNNHNLSNSSPTFANMSAPFFNMTNGMTFDPDLLQQADREEMTEAERAELTAGAPMSPSTAGALLPSNLFGDDAASSATSEQDPEARIAAVLEGDAPRPTYASYRRIINDDASSLNHKSNRNSAALPGLGVIPGLGASSTAEVTENRDPSSPTSANSRSPSLYASPRASTNHLPYQDSFNEIDRRSIRSNTNSSLGQKGRSRFFDGLSRLGHRAGKSSQDEGPALGSLRSAQTRSMPQQDLSSQGVNDPKRRGSHTGTGWMGMPSISQAFSRGAKENEASNGPSHEMPRSSRLRPFGFGKSGGGDPWLASSLLSRSTGPRPSSTHSSDIANMLPRPETGSETRFGWPVEASVSERQLISPLSVDWATQNAPSWSRQPSRRQSVQYGPFGSDLYHDDEMSPPARYSPAQAPIGTRPQTSHGHGSGSGSGEGTSAPPTPDQTNMKPSLNPAAPSFSLAFLSRSKKADDSENTSTPKSEKRKEKKSKGRERDAIDPTASSSVEMNASMLETPRVEFKDSSSPPESRKSRDNRSISTADESFLDSSIASIPRSSLEQTRSLTPSESQSQLTPLGSRDSTGTKESFMQKLSRKTSQTGSKLSRPFSFTARKSTATTSPALEGRDSTPTPDEWDEDLRKSIDSIHFAPPSASSVANSPVVRPSLDAGGLGTEEAAENSKKDKARGKGSSKGWGSLKLTSRKEKKKADEIDAEESVTTSEADTADEDGEDVTAP